MIAMWILITERRLSRLEQKIDDVAKNTCAIRRELWTRIQSKYKE